MKPPSTLYRGVRICDAKGGRIAVVVTVDGRRLLTGPSQRIRNHSPTGFEWGYRGSGPAQLALAILLDVTGDPETAERYYQRYKEAAVGNWGDRWETTAAEVLRWLDQFEREELARDIEVTEGGAP